MSPRTWSYAAISLSLLASAAAARPSDQIHIIGPGITVNDWGVTQLQTQLATEVKPIQYKSHGADHTFDCVPLVSVLKAAGAETNLVMKPGSDPKTKNPQMRQVIVVSGRDGYSVVFSLAEILPMIGNRPVWVALDEDGKPLSQNDGPVRLIVPDDGMPTRGVHQVASIDLVDMSAPTTQSANP